MNVEEEIDYVMGKVQELESGEAEDKGARIENKRNHNDIKQLKSRIRSIEQKMDELEVLKDRIDLLEEKLREVKN